VRIPGELLRPSVAPGPRSAPVGCMAGAAIIRRGWEFLRPGDCTKRPTAAHGRIFAVRRWCVVNAADRVIRWSTALAVLGVAAIAAVVSYEHASSLVRAHRESGWTGRLIPLTMDGLIYASSMVMLDASRRGVRVPALARWLLGLGITATLAANVSHGLGHGVIGAAVAAWPALALVGSCELLMVIIRCAHMPLVTPSAHDDAPMTDPLSERAQRCSRLIWQTTGFHRYAPFVERCMPVSRERSGCAS
jgi:hypothetical protein